MTDNIVDIKNFMKKPEVTRTPTVADVKATPTDEAALALFEQDGDGHIFIPHSFMQESIITLLSDIEARVAQNPNVVTKEDLGAFVLACFELLQTLSDNTSENHDDKLEAVMDTYDNLHEKLNAALS